MKEKTFEENLKRIEEILCLLEENKQSLEDTTALFEEAMKLIEICEGQLNTTEEKINRIIMKDHIEI